MISAKLHQLYVPAAFALILLLSYCILNWATKTDRIKGITTNFTASEIISITNVARTGQGIKPLHPNPQLMRAAEAKAQAMLSANSWGHNTPNETPWVFIDESGYIYMYAGENLAKDFDSPEKVVEAWLNSPSHRQNLLNQNFTETGVAVVEAAYQNRPKTTLVVQYLAKAYVPGEDRIDEQHLEVTQMISGLTNNIRPLHFLIGFMIFCFLVIGGLMFILITKRLPKIKNHPSSKYWRTK